MTHAARPRPTATGAALSTPELIAACKASRSVARVVAVEAIPVALPLRRPVGFASGTIDTAHHVLVRIYADTGAVGCAEAQPRPYTYGETQESILDAVRGWFAPRLNGLDPVAGERARTACAGLEGNHCARGAIEIALADLAGHVLDLPCSTLLGGGADSIAVASMLSFGSPEEMAEEAIRLHGTFGIATFKAKVGRDVALDVAAVTAVREALPAATLYVDANRGWTLAQARAAAPALIELGVTAIEEPLDLADTEGRRLLASEWSVPLAGDESCRSLAETARELAGPVGQVSIKVARTGFAESREILAACRAAGAEAIVGSQYEAALGAWASIAFAAGALWERPAEAGNFLDLAADLATAPVIADGHVSVPGAPGLGATLDPAALQHYRMDG
jgi:L-alanine-DL-glutamate epimerase-like enolase superfamily enzyme